MESLSRSTKIILSLCVVALPVLVGALLITAETVSVAQTSCPRPNFRQEDASGNPVGDAFYHSWAPGPGQVVVKIDSDWNETDRNTIKAGVET